MLRINSYEKIAGLILIPLFLFSLFCCSGRKKKDPETREKVLLFGMDGGEWHLLLPLVKMGSMPTFSRFFLAGSRGPLFSHTMASPVEWTSIVTGKSSEKHGITSWAKAVEGATKEFHVITRKARTSQTLWNILSTKKIPVAVIGWWATWPAEAVDGINVTDAFMYRHTIEQTLYPPELLDYYNGLEQAAHTSYQNWLRDINLLDGDGEVKEFPQDVRFSSGQVKTFLRQLMFDFLKFQVASSIIRDQPHDFIALYFRASDLASHFFYKDCCLEDGEEQWLVSPADREFFSPIIPHVYRLYDTFLSRIIDLYEQEPSVIIVSDHGFGSGPYYKNFNIKGFLRKSELKVRDTPVYPQVMIRHDKNQAGRDRIYLKDPSQSPFDLQELRTVLSSVVTDSGRSLFKVITLVSAQDGQAAETFLETAVNPGIALMDTVMTSSSTLHAFEFHRFSKFSGAHRPYGIALFQGQPFEIDHTITSPLTTWDICPTILHLFQLPRARDMDGSVILDCFQASYQQRLPLSVEIPTYEEPGKHDEIPEIGDKINQELVEELKSIGYL